MKGPEGPLPFRNWLVQSKRTRAQAADVPAQCRLEPSNWPKRLKKQGA
jgi:hypothetical protein